MASTDLVSRSQRFGILPWLRLMRLPNVFTAIADVAMGYLFVNRAVHSPGSLSCLIAASASLYTAGMVLNDVFDYEVDARERPFRPLPSGQISLAAARLLGFGLLATGIALGAIAGHVPGAAPTAPWLSGMLATLLAACVLAYDGYLKKTPAGPLGMGACRFLNVLLGASVAAPDHPRLPLGFESGVLLAAAGIGTYIIGVTWFARSEANTSRAAVLAAAMAVMTAGVGILGSIAVAVRLRVQPQFFWLLLAVLSLPVLRRGFTAVIDPSPEKVQGAVKQSILTLIWLDAAVVLVVADSVYAVAIAALLIPALLLGRWVYST